MLSSGSDVPNHTPSSLDFPALVLTLWEAQLEAVENCPFLSVTTIWDSPVVLLVILNGTPARRLCVPAPIFTPSISPRLIWLQTEWDLSVKSTIFPSSVIEKSIAFAPSVK